MLNTNKYIFTLSQELHSAKERSTACRGARGAHGMRGARSCALREASFVRVHRVC